MFLFPLIAEKINIDLIRGISPQIAPKYRRYMHPHRNQFDCFDGSKSIPISHVNDGYCDCPDGSDEPGTNACGKGEFFCRNEGSIPKFIPMWAVDDGVCDCCDGSDERGNPYVQCEDKCGTMKRRSQQFRANLTNMTKVGGRLRQKYIDRGRLELKLRRAQLKYVNSQKTRIYKLADMVERIYWDLRNGKDITDQVEELESLINETDEEFEEITQLEKKIRNGTRKIIERVPHSGRFNLEKRLKRHFNVENAICWLPDYSLVFERLDTAFSICQHFLKSYKKRVPPSKATSVFNKLSSITTKIDNTTAVVTELLDVDFGPDKEYLMLYGQWYYFERDDFYLEFYPYKNLTKTGKNGGSPSLLGKYANSTSLRWHFADGHSCGARLPNAQTEVRLHCRLQDGILNFHEFEEGHYRLDFGTPAACTSEYQRRAKDLDDETLDEWAKDSGLY